MITVHFVSLRSDEVEEPEFNSHESVAVKTMIKAPSAAKGKHCACAAHLWWRQTSELFVIRFSTSHIERW